MDYQGKAGLRSEADSVVSARRALSIAPTHHLAHVAIAKPDAAASQGPVRQAGNGVTM